MKIKLNKRQKYFIHAALLLGLLYYFSGNTTRFDLAYAALVLVVVLVGSYLTHRPNSTVLNTLATGIMPVFLTLGFVLSYIYFPNLSRVFKLLSLGVYAFIFYIVSLVNNVFLVVETRKETMPLYRVASTWSKILIVVVAIPLLAGIFKMDINSLFETALASLATILFYIYLLWSLKYNHEVKKFKKGELVAVFALGTFFVFAANISVSFFPTETFLRALYVSSVLIFGVSFIEAHLKNTINKKLIREHSLLTLIFLILLFIFNP
ncbi:hypothetical protein ACFLZK_01325 [Patescibacteria group bacterium]